VIRKLRVTFCDNPEDLSPTKLNAKTYEEEKNSEQETNCEQHTGYLFIRSKFLEGYLIYRTRLQA